MSKPPRKREPRYDAARPQPAPRVHETGPVTVTATEAKNRFGPLLEAALQGRSVIITKHDAPKAVLISMAEFESLTGGARHGLDALSDEFDTLVERLQTPASRKALKAAFSAAPAELGRRAVGAVRRRG